MFGGQPTPVMFDPWTKDGNSTGLDGNIMQDLALDMDESGSIDGSLNPQ